MATHLVSFETVLESLGSRVDGAIRIINEDLQPEHLLSNKATKEKLLTYAEQVLICEGNQLGIADCTIPPYVEYENLLVDEIRPNVIRSEVMEWAMGLEVSKRLFKAGTLKILGADFITNGDLSNKKYRGKGSTNDALERDEVFDNNDRFSLDLSSREISLDLEFGRCRFFSGINISNSYFENLSFQNCQFGCAKLEGPHEPMTSILAKNVVLKGEFSIDTSSDFIARSRDNIKPIANAHVDFSQASVEGLFSITQESSAQTTIKGYLSFRSFRGSSIHLSNCKIDGELGLVVSRFDFLFANGSVFGSISCGGMECEGFAIRNKSIVKLGLECHKSTVRNNLDFSDSFFGCIDIDDGAKGIAITLRSSMLRSVALSGSTIVGSLDLRYTNIEDSITFENTLILGDKQEGRRTAINGHHLAVKKELRFNVSRKQKQNKQTSKQIILERIIELSTGLDSYTDAVAVHQLFDRYSSSYDWASVVGVNFFVNVSASAQEDYQKYGTIILGDVNFDHAVVDGSVDCAGTIFKCDSVRNDNTQASVLSFQYARINGPLFVNRGSYEFPLPFVVDGGEVNLGNAEINNLFITVPDNRRKRLPLNLIGTKYNFIEDVQPKKAIIPPAQTRREKVKRAVRNLPSWVWMQTLALFQYLFPFMKSSLYFRASWIRRKKKNNFRHPFEQFASALFRSGEDQSARDVLVYWRPSTSPLGWIAMLPIKIMYYMGSRIYLCFIFLIGSVFLGQVIYSRMFEQSFIVDSSKHGFDGMLFSLQRLLPLIDIIDKNNYYLADITPRYYVAYYILHPLVGTVLIAMLLVNIARVRKGDT